jgi:hypothetical protein
MAFPYVGLFQETQAAFPFWLETLSIFLGDVLATVFVAGAAYAFWYLMKYPGFRAGANWTSVGWDAQKMGRLPNEADTGKMVLMPNISITSHDIQIKKVIAAVWVRERADINDPGEILGHRDLQREGVPVEARTTGGDQLRLTGPKIECQASAFKRITFFPIFVQTSDGEFHKAESPGNAARGIVKLRYRIQNGVYAVKRRILAKLS